MGRTRSSVLKIWVAGPDPASSCGFVPSSLGGVGGLGVVISLSYISNDVTREWRNGRRAGFRCQCPIRAWRFNSSLAHNMSYLGVSQRSGSAQGDKSGIALLMKYCGSFTSAMRSRMYGSIIGMKLSVSLRDEDVAFLDEYTQTASLESRSAAVQEAVQALRSAILAEEYTQMFSDPTYLKDAREWDVTSADGLADEAW